MNRHLISRSCRSAVPLLVSMAMLLSCAWAPAAHAADAVKPFAAPAEVTADQRWQGDVLVSGTVKVAAGATLTIAPGTTIRFVDEAMLEVMGKIVAIGTPDSPITFTSAGRKEPSAWKEVSLESANGSEFAHCVFEYATWGIHTHFTHFLVKESRFTKNMGGIRYMSGFAEIRRNVFEDNTIGIRWRAGRGQIEENVITRNEFGLFVKEKGGNPAITRNDIFGNTGYNFRIGDFVDEDADARGNWWGPGNPADTIYDGRKETGLGKVNFEPFLNGPVRQR